MTIYLGADHGGFALKEKIKEWLTSWGYVWKDCGNMVFDPEDDFPDFAARVAEAVSAAPLEDTGIVICRSGAGMDMVVNKYPGILASLVFAPEQAWRAKKDDRLNIIALPSDYLSEESVREIVKIWLETPFEAETPKRLRRLKKISEIEKKVMGQRKSEKTSEQA